MTEDLDIDIGTLGSLDPVWDELLTHPIEIISVIDVAASKLLTARPLILCGFCLRDTGGSNCTFDLYDGQDTGGQPVASGDTIAHGMAVMGVEDQGPYCRRGLYLSRVAGTIRGAVWVRL